MTDANENEMHEAIIQELNKLSISDVEIENEEEEETCFSEEEYVSCCMSVDLKGYFMKR